MLYLATQAKVNISDIDWILYKALVTDISSRVFVWNSEQVAVLCFVLCAVHIDFLSVAKIFEIYNIIWRKRHIFLHRNFEEPKHPKAASCIFQGTQGSLNFTAKSCAALCSQSCILWNQCKGQQQEDLRWIKKHRKLKFKILPIVHSLWYS